MRFEASAPSNIALIKYMGKAGDGNRPANASLSFTLEKLRSFVFIEIGETRDEWRPLRGFDPLALSDLGRKKFLDHFTELKKLWNVPGFHTVYSANNFPSDCGLASSASSFAALTLATWELAGKPDVSREDLSRLSRRGSGSSCRSFFSPWALWRDEGGESVELDLALHHAAVLAGADRKSVSSSQAHTRVLTSRLFAGRVERAEHRLSELLSSLKTGDWKRSFELCWNEFFDMHALFETSRPPFGYFNSESFRILQHLRAIWEQEGDGPLVTMDAGPNVHLLFRGDQLDRADSWLNGFRSLKSWEQLK